MKHTIVALFQHLYGRIFSVNIVLATTSPMYNRCNLTWREVLNPARPAAAWSRRRTLLLGVLWKMDNLTLCPLNKINHVKMVDCPESSVCELKVPSEPTSVSPFQGVSILVNQCKSENTVPTQSTTGGQSLKVGPSPDADAPLPLASRAILQLMLHRQGKCRLGNIFFGHCPDHCDECGALWTLVEWFVRVMWNTFR